MVLDEGHSTPEQNNIGIVRTGQCCVKSTKKWDRHSCLVSKIGEVKGVMRAGHTKVYNAP